MPGRRPRRRHPHSALCVQGLRVSGLEGCVFWGLRLTYSEDHQQISADFKARIPSVLARSHPTVRVDPNEHVSLSDWPIYPHGPLLGLTWLSPQRYLYVTHRYSA
eukprot:7057987-Pyramimonas_sp.AAC.1